MSEWAMILNYAMTAFSVHAVYPFVSTITA